MSAAAPGQHRLARIQVVNWGTFQGAFGIDVPRDGMLITGPSGSGKSSLLDALSAVLVPPRWLAFNAAAQEGGSADRSRSLVSYVRGAYRREADDVTGEVTTAYLRDGATWSGIALTFDDSTRLTTLIRLFHLARGANAMDDLASLLVIADGPVELLSLQDLVANGLELRRLRSRHADWDVFTRYSAFAARVQRRLGLASDQAQRLLHKTQSAKNLNSLDTLLRDFMLDEPDTFDLADQAVAQFGELTAAHASVVDARRQVETLLPLEAIGTELARLETETESLTRQLDHLPVFEQRTRLDRARDDARQKTGLLRGLERELAQATAASTSAQEERDAWNQRLLGAGGAELATLAASIRAERDLWEQRRRRWDSMAPVAERAGLSLAADAEEHARLQQEAERRGRQVDADRESRRAAGYELVRAKHEADARVRVIQEDLKVLLAQQSNLEPHLLRVRALLTDRLGLTRETLPFAGELIDVREEASDWAGAIERVLRPLARTLLVPDGQYAAVAELVDTTQLGTRLVYERIPADVAAPDGAPSDPRSLVRKVMLQPGPWAHWLAAELLRRYDYACVETIPELVRAPRAVTRAGQIKHSATRHEKDDRRPIDDRRSWVLGFSTAAKETRLRETLREAATTAADADQALRADEDSRDAIGAMAAALAELRRLAWEEIDTGQPRRRLDDLVRRQEVVRAAASGLGDTEARLAAATQAYAEAEETRRRLQSRRDRTAGDLDDLRSTIARLEERLAAQPDVPEEAGHTLSALFAEEWERVGTGPAVPEAPLREAFQAVERRLRDALAQREKRRQDAGRRSERTMQTYKTSWPAQAAELAIRIDFLPDYLAILAGLRADRLPEFEERFFDLLQSQSRNNIGNLSLRITMARRKVRERIDPINTSLAGTEYAPGRHLQVKVDDRRVPELTEFLGALGRITAGSIEDTLGADDSTAGRQQAEERFLEMQRILSRLSSTEAPDRRWRAQCLDTRLHVEFTAVVQDTDGRPVDYYTGAGGLSGGERQKLVVFCLAAALRYQLAREGADQPQYGLVVLDEAFDKTDPEFTRAGLEVFRTFGFQLLLATPMKMLQTLEDYVGGTTLVLMDPSHHSHLEVMRFDAEEPAGAPTDSAEVPGTGVAPGVPADRQPPVGQPAEPGLW